MTHPSNEPSVKPYSSGTPNRESEVIDLHRQAKRLAAVGDWGVAAEALNRRLVELMPARTVAYTMFRHRRRRERRLSRHPNEPIVRLRFRLERRGGPDSVYRRWQLVAGSVAATVGLLLIMALVLTSLFVMMLVTIALVIAGVLIWATRDSVRIE